MPKGAQCVGVPQDWMRAHMWLSRTMVQGFGGERGRLMLERTATERLTASQLAESRRLVQEWFDSRRRR